MAKNICGFTNELQSYLENIFWATRKYNFCQVDLSVVLKDKGIEYKSELNRVEKRKNIFIFV